MVLVSIPFPAGWPKMLLGREVKSWCNALNTCGYPGKHCPFPDQTILTTAEYPMVSVEQNPFGWQKSFLWA